jgi:septal ring factor EnvC (AmiA/AmiB activator)
MIGCTNKSINTEKDIINSDTSLSNILERSSKHLQQSGVVVQDANEKQVKEVKNIVTSIVTLKETNTQLKTELVETKQVLNETQHELIQTQKELNIITKPNNASKFDLLAVPETDNH